MAVVDGMTGELSMQRGNVLSSGSGSAAESPGDSVDGERLSTKGK